MAIESALDVDTWQWRISFKDPTIREKFNTYRYKDYKERIVDLLMRITAVSVRTVGIVDAMKSASR